VEIGLLAQSLPGATYIFTANVRMDPDDNETRSQLFRPVASLAGTPMVHPVHAHQHTRAVRAPKSANTVPANTASLLPSDRLVHLTALGTRTCRERTRRSMDSLRGSSVDIGTIQRRLAWPLRKDHAHRSRSVNRFHSIPYHYCRPCGRPPQPPGGSWRAPPS